MPIQEVVKRHPLTSTKVHHRAKNKQFSTLRCTKTGSTQPKLSAACFVVQSCLADADFVVFSNYCLIGTRLNEPHFLFYAIFVGLENDDAALCALFDLIFAAGETNDLFPAPQREKIIDVRHVFKSYTCAAVVHRNDHLRVERERDLLCLLRAYRVVAADGDHQNVYCAEFGRRFGVERVSEIAEMRKPQSLRADYAAQIVAAQSTELAVVICGYPRQLKAGLGAGQLNSGGVVMVGVRVAANNTVGAQGLKL